MSEDIQLSVVQIQFRSPTTSSAGRAQCAPGISDEEVRRLYKLQEALNRVPVDETAFKYDKVHAFVGMNMSH